MPTASITIHITDADILTTASLIIRKSVPAEVFSAVKINMKSVMLFSGIARVKKILSRGLLCRVLDRPYTCRTILNDQYEIVKVLGMGSYGISYLSRDQKDGKLCVLKQVKPSKKRTKEGLEAFQYETSLLQQLNHPSIPSFYQWFRYRSDYFFSMEYMPGRNFEDLIFEDNVEFSEQQSLHIILKLLSIVEYLHENHVIHRDIRLPNVIIMNGELKLIDFGLARRLGDSSESVCGSDAPVEKQLRREINCKSDFYALGHFLLFLLYTTYVPCHSSNSGGWEEELKLSVWTRNFIRRLLQLDAAYSDIAELRGDLFKAIEDNKSSEEDVNFHEKRV